MKKYKVIKEYVDKYTLDLHYRGSTVELTPSRAFDLADYVEEIKETKKKEIRKDDVERVAKFGTSFNLGGA